MNLKKILVISMLACLAMVMAYLMIHAGGTDPTYSKAHATGYSNGIAFYKVYGSSVYVDDLPITHKHITHIRTMTGPSDHGGEIWYVVPSASGANLILIDRYASADVMDRAWDAVDSKIINDIHKYAKRLENTNSSQKPK